MRFALLLLIVALCGCSSLLKSRYAMDDSVYAKKYADGADRWDLLGKAKQALDARHTEGLGGAYLSGGAQTWSDSGDSMFGGDLGIEAYTTSWLTSRASLSGYAGYHDWFTGADLGVRLQTPTRVAPFIGVGTFQGFSESKKLADNDGIDNNNDGWTDEIGERNDTIDGFLSVVYPEVGVHTWINGNWRVTAFGRYLVTSQGRAHDDWLLGLQLTLFGRESSE